ncbi:MAG: hypothetical protein KGL39_22140 [Patescibacteria group bacterium]|nr:hypothetical protein [Patescibacteria group bacterium]
MRQTISAIFALVVLWAFPAHAQSITSFTGACYSGASTFTTGACAAGDNIPLVWTTTGASGCSISASVGASPGSVPCGSAQTVTVQPFNTASVVYTLSCTSCVSATVTVNLTDDYTLMSSWATTKRAYGFDSAITCNTNGLNAEPVVVQPGYGTGGGGPSCFYNLDTTKAVSGTGSYLDTIPSLAGQNPDGELTIAMSPSGATTFGPGDDLYIQYRMYMPSAYLTPLAGGSGCPANLTVGGVSPSFTVGETVTDSISSASGVVLSWSGSTLYIAGGTTTVWQNGATLTGSMGGHGTTTTNNGAGSSALSGCADLTLSGISGGSLTFNAGDSLTSNTTAASGTVMVWSPSLNRLIVAGYNYPHFWTAGGTPPYKVIDSTTGTTGTITSENSSNYNGTGMKQIMFEAGDLVTPPTTSSQQSGNCYGPHLVTTLNFQQAYGQSYVGCSQVGGYGQYSPFEPAYFPGTSPQYALLSGVVGCLFVNNSSGGYATAGTPAVAPCVNYFTDEWMTVQYHFHVGPWYMIAQPGYPAMTATFSGGSSSTGNHLSSFSITSPGSNWPPNSTITICGEAYTYPVSGTQCGSDSFVLARTQNGMATSTDTAVITCTVDQYGQIPQSACTITADGSDHNAYPQGTFAVRLVPHSCCNLTRQGTVERWQAHAGQPSVLVESYPYFDFINAPANPNDWTGSQNYCGNGTCPWNYGKIWLTSYSTGRDPNAGPYNGLERWIDDLLIGTARFADPGVAVQPVTGVTIDKTHLLDGSPSVTISWTHNPESNGTTFAETGFDVERCPGQIWDCMSGAVSGATWSTIGSVASGTFAYTDSTGTFASQIYSYRVRATGGNNSDWSTPVTSALLPPTGAAAQWTGASSIQVSWVQSDEVGKFNVLRCNGVFQPKSVIGLSGQSEDDQSCLPASTSCTTSSCVGNGSVAFSTIATGLAGSTKGSTITYIDSTVTAGNPYTYRVVGATGAGSYRDFSPTSLHAAASNFAIPQSSGCTITQTSLPNGTVGTAYSQTLTESNCGAGTLTWTVTGSLPPGLSGCNSVVGTSCTISGTPTTTVGSPFGFTVQVTDGVSNTATQTYSVSISGGGGATVTRSIHSSSGIRSGGLQ